MFIKIRFNNQGERTQGERVVRANGPDTDIGPEGRYQTRAI